MRTARIGRAPWWAPDWGAGLPCGPVLRGRTRRAAGRRWRHLCERRSRKRRRRGRGRVQWLASLLIDRIVSLKASNGWCKTHSCFPGTRAPGNRWQTHLVGPTRRPSSQKTTSCDCVPKRAGRSGEIQVGRRREQKGPSPRQFERSLR